VAYRSRPRPSSTLGAKASTTCPYYLDGDLGRLPRIARTRRAVAWVRPVIPVATRAYRVRVAVAAVQFSRTVREGCARERRHDGRRSGDAVSQNSTACTGSSSAVCLAGPARFGRHARPHDRRPALPDHSRPKWRAGRAAPCRTGTVLVLPRKEVIQPHLPVRLPCYDFTPVTSPTFDGSLPCGLGHRLRVLLTPVV
jgi:hypothetical protein